jgi:lipid A 3-O-deacylase
MKTLAVISFLAVFLFSCSGPEADKEEPGQFAAPPRHTKGPADQKNRFATGQPNQFTPPNKANLRNRHQQKTPAEGDVVQAPRQPDTLLIQKLNQLRSLHVEPDLNEPVSEEYLFSPVEAGPFPSVIELSREQYFRVQVDNDLIDNTDRFYTNGILLEYIGPALSRSPLSKLMVPYWHQGTNYYGMSLVQNMYTSSMTKKGGIPYGDRPYAAYLYLSSFKISNDRIHRLRQTSELQVGVIGSASQGGAVQTWFHNTVPTNDEPLGWDYQIANDLLLNYLVSYEKGVVSGRNVELNLTGTGILGTVYIQANGGLYFRAGDFNPYFSSLGFSKRSVNHSKGMKNTQYYVFLKATGTAVGYDATLQGGMFNHDNAYTIPGDSLSRFKFTASAGLAFSYGGARLDLEQHFISPEFTGGLWHMWMGLGLTFSF